MYGHSYFKTREKIGNWIKSISKSKCPEEYWTVDKEGR